VSTHLVAVGVSHRTAKLAVRERLALDGAGAERLSAALVDGGAADEAMALSTCNRMEVYVAAADPDAAQGAVLRVLARRAGVAPAALREHAYVLRDAEAARHLFAVAGGLDSMVLGETQILGQLRRAHAAGTSGPLLDRLVRDGLAAARRIREQTAVGRAGVSVSSAAVELARAALGDLEGRRVLVVGAGKSGELTAQVLADRGVDVVIASRRHADEPCPAGRVSLQALAGELERADVVLTATAAPHPIITRDELALAMERRSGRPLLVIDLAVPRDVEPAARSLAGLTLLDMDDVQRRVEGNLAARRAEAGRAEALAAAEADRFERWRAALGATETVAELRRGAGTIVDDLLRENALRWEGMTVADRARVEALARAVATRVLDAPTRRLRATGDDPAALEAARALFGLGDEAPAARRATA
jgi:glutamyl-tRNA reductase